MGEDDGRTARADAATEGTAAGAATRGEGSGRNDAVDPRQVARGVEPEAGGTAAKGTADGADGESAAASTRTPADPGRASEAPDSGRAEDAEHAGESEEAAGSDDASDASDAVTSVEPEAVAAKPAEADDAEPEADDAEAPRAREPETAEPVTAAPGRETGRLLAGRYRLGGVQGRGGMGTVWRARDEILGRTVAVKELRFPSDIDEDEKRRLITRTLREAKAIARIRSGSAVTVFDVVEEDDRPWIVMELVEGRSLADVIREEGPVTPRRAAEIGLAILGVLRAAHREGIVHRDVKPSNVLIEQDTGRVVLTDFGIAKVEGDPSVTSTGMLVGAPSYISPERARGGRPGPPADMWSLGGLLYAAVEGTPPYDKGSAIATLTAVMTDPLEPPHNAGELEEVIYGLLLKDPAKRLDEAGARGLLQAVLDAPEEPAPAGPGGTRTVALPAARPTKGERASGAAASRAAASDAPAATGREKTGAVPAGQGESKRQPLAAFVTTAGRSGEGAGDGGSRRRPPGAVIAAIVVVLVGVLGAVLAFTLNSGDGDDPSGKDDASSSGVTSGGDGDDGGSSGDGGTDGDSGARGNTGDDGANGAEDTGGTGEPGGAGEDQGGNGGEPGDGLPDGYIMVTDDRFHFSMAMPEGWSRVDIAGRNSGGIYAAEKGGVPSVQVDYTSTPTDSAMSAWELLEKAVKGNFRDYSLIGIEPVEWRDYPTVADWTYEHTRDGQRLRSLNRGFRVDAGRGHAILVTCRADAWDGEECRTLRETAFATFKPEEE
ncbi:protein kinase domain-containing protein [Streptomyces sp. WMMC1477]|uniref:protein kinase domain-containing protein n=1 Tax=Streptomyces sp. WMMC1477 TaxID=3015155 RepID=UPI0022B6D30D|nr:protein kinase [Streptomyces sp. WMMC1477]MCZ7433024.1 protein kinase [Streptomyces sp. WMMC1477]